MPMSDVEGLPEKVERFNVTCYYTDEGHPEATMLPSPIGAYVLYSDYAAQVKAEALSRANGAKATHTKFYKCGLCKDTKTVIDYAGQPLDCGPCKDAALANGDTK